MSTTRVVLPPGAAVSSMLDDEPMADETDAQAAGRQRRAVERKEGTQPYIVRERVAVSSIDASESLPPPPEPRRDSRERAGAARPASGALRSVRNVRSDDLRLALRDRAGFGGGSGGARAGGGGSDLRGSISKARRTGDRDESRAAKGLQHFAARRASAHVEPPRHPRAGGGAGGFAEGSEASRADGEWKRDLYFKLGGA